MPRAPAAVTTEGNLRESGFGRVFRRPGPSQPTIAG